MSHIISPDQLDSFKQNGFVTISKFFNSDELNLIRSWVDEIAGWSTDESNRGHHHFEKTENGPALARSEDIVSHHEGMKQLLAEGKVIQAISDLFEEQASLFKEKINYKLVGGGGFAPHQDITAYAYGSVHITCLVAIDDSDEENGCLWFSPGNHKSGLLPGDGKGCLDREFSDTLQWQASPVPAGGAAFFDSFAPHFSESNRSNNPRRALYVTYTKKSEGDLRAQYYEDRQARLEKLKSENPGTKQISTIGHFEGDIL